jgi:hypothetical protein
MDYTPESKENLNKKMLPELAEAIKKTLKS